jgi:integrase
LGHVQKRREAGVVRRWRAFYDEPTGEFDDEGRAVTRRRTAGFRTKREAEQFLRDVEGAIARNEFVAPSPICVGPLLHEWLAVVRTRVRPSTFGQYEAAVRRIERHTRLATVEAQRLSRPGLSAALEALSNAPSGRGREAATVSATTVQHSWRVLRSALAWAVGEGLLARNLAAGMPGPKRSTPETPTWTPAQLQTFLASVAEDRLAAIWRLAAVTGARRSELLGLRWADLDLGPEPSARIERSRVLVEGRMVDQEPKTARSRRTVALDPETAEALRRYELACKAERLKAGPGVWPEHPQVVVDELGRGLRGDGITQRFERLARASGLPRIGFHGLRHSVASSLLAAGMPVLEVSRRLGHSTATMTLDVYGHVTPAADRALAEQFARLLEGR